MRITQIISNKCNCSCFYCLNGKYAHESEVSLEDLISFYSKLDKGEDIFLKITGGEVFYPGVVSKTIGLITYMLNNFRMEKIQLNTNGFFPIPEKLINDKIIFQISLDGNKFYQNKICGVDIYDRIINNLKLLKSKKGKAHIMCVVTEENLQYIDDVYNIGKEYGFEVKLQYIAPVGRAENYNIEKVKDRIDEINQKYPNSCRSYASECSNLQPDIDSRFAIDTRGNIIMCPYMQDFKSGLTIFNTNPKDGEKIKNALEIALCGKTCRTANQE